MTNQQELNYELPSQEELGDSKGKSSPLEPEDYIIKLAKIEYVKAPVYVNNKFSQTQFQPMFKIIALVHSLKSGDLMHTVEGDDVASLTRWLWRDVNPKSIGFMQDGSPSFIRALICFLENMPVNGRLKAPGFIVVDKDLNEVKDDKYRQKMLKEVMDENEPKDLTKKGYTLFSDIRPYEGRYIACAIGLNKNGYNKVSRFSKLPTSFVFPSPEEELEAMDKFKEGYAKMQEKMRNKGSVQNSDSTVEASEPVSADEVQIDDLPW